MPSERQGKQARDGREQTGHQPVAWPRGQGGPERMPWLGGWCDKAKKQSVPSNTLQREKGRGGLAGSGLIARAGRCWRPTHGGKWQPTKCPALLGRAIAPAGGSTPVPSHCWPGFILTCPALHAVCYPPPLPGELSPDKSRGAR